MLSSKKAMWAIVILLTLIATCSFGASFQDNTPEFRLAPKPDGQIKTTTSMTSAVASETDSSVVRSGPRYLPDGASASVRGVCLKYLDYAYTSDNGTTWYPGCLVGSTDRSFGLLLINTDGTVPLANAGDWIEASGSMFTTGDSERALAVFSSVNTPGSYLPRPLAMQQKAMGGQSSGWNIGVSDATGLNTMGVLVKTSGKVLYGAQNSSGAIIDDGSQIGSTGIYISSFNYDINCVTGEFASFAGVVRPCVKNGKVYQYLEFNNSPTAIRYSDTGKVIFAVQGGIEAAGKEVRIADDTIGFSLKLDASGNASCTQIVKRGQHTFSCKAYGYATEGASLDLDTTGTITFVLRKIEERLIMSAPFNVLPADGTSEVEVYIKALDLEGYAPEQGNVTFSIDNGAIVNQSTLSPGEAVATVRASTNHETGRLIARYGNAIGAYLLYFNDAYDISATDPLVNLESPEKYTGETVSGRIYISWLFDDIERIFQDPNVFLEFHLSSYKVYLDGVLIEEDIPMASPKYGNYPLVGTTEVITNEHKNGPHTVQCVSIDEKGNESKSPILSFVSDNEVSDQKYLVSDESLGREIDALNGGVLTFTATLKNATSWQLIGRDIGTSVSSGWSYSRILASGTGTEVNAVFDGMLYPNRELCIQPDLIHIGLHTGPNIGAESLNETNDEVGDWVGVRVIPDSEVEVLTSTGKPNYEDWATNPEEYERYWPFRTYTLYINAKNAGYRAKQLGIRQSNWQRWSSIVGNGNCQMVHHHGHGFVKPIGFAGAYQTYFLLPASPGGKTTFVTSEPVSNPQYTSIKTAFTTYGSWIRFFFLDSCASGYIAGWAPGPFGFPSVNQAAENDMARALNMYGYDEYSYCEPKTYLGWYSYTSGLPDYLNFVSSMARPYGFLQLWGMEGGGKILGDVVGNSAAFTYPEVLTQWFSPYSWNGIYGNLRLFGDGDYGANLGFLTLMF